MAIGIGIVGLPNVGKSTLFNALTDAEVLAANYPFATIEPNTGHASNATAASAKPAMMFRYCPRFTLGSASGFGGSAGAFKMSLAL